MEEDSAPQTKAKPLQAFRDCLVDVAQPIAKRTHAAFYLRTAGTLEAVDAISEALRNKQDSALLRHELAYILGQIQNPAACPVLNQILGDESDDTMVRHEAAEALGAIGRVESVEVLEQFSNDPAKEVADTCRLALDLIAWKHNESDDTRGDKEKNPYLSVDPAPPTASSLPVEELRKHLLDENRSLFERYRAMFALRNRAGTNGDSSAVLALADGFHDSSPLFRHEIAYVLGQIQSPVSVPALKAVLEREQEHRMVRHEAAEALGAVGGEEAEVALKAYLGDGEPVVRESCEVALDTAAYWNEKDFHQ